MSVHEVPISDVLYQCEMIDDENVFKDASNFVHLKKLSGVKIEWVNDLGVGREWRLESEEVHRQMNDDDENVFEGASNFVHLKKLSGVKIELLTR